MVVTPYHNRTIELNAKLGEEILYPQCLDGDVDCSLVLELL
jgi:hypothetical protein